MAKAPQLIIALILMFHIFITMVVAGHDIPNVNIKKRDDVKQPDSLINHDRSFPIPGVGRVIKPKYKDGYNPFTYNPVTGTNNGGILGGRHLPTFGRVGRRRYVPGGDDTFVPNPGFEVPNPASGRVPPSPTND